MATIQHQVPKLSDASLMELFTTLRSELSFTNLTFAVGGQDGAVNWDDPSLVPVREQNKYAIWNASGYRNAPSASGSITFTRNANSSQPLTPDRIDINNNNAFQIPDLLKIHALIDSAFFTTRIDTAAIMTNPGAFAEVIASHQAIIDRLETSLSKIGAEFSSQRIALEQEFQSRKQSLEETYRKESETQRGEYDAKVTALSEREKALDDRDNMHARREVRQDIKKQLHEYASKFTLTSSTKHLRMPIHITVVISLVVLSALISFITYKFSQESSISPAALTSFLVKSALLTIAALGLLAWYVRWMNRWFEQHAGAEFHLKQFELDIDRATWVVETAMEWRASQHGIIPTALLESISRNMFALRDSGGDDDMHPADYLATALLGNASHAKLKLGDAELDYSRPSLKKAAKAVSHD